MPKDRVLQEALRDIVESTIYYRGLDYYRSGQVREWWIDTVGQMGRVRVTGIVEGGDIYEVALEYDPTTKRFTQTDCSCPYGDTCKHVVALGLAFVNSLEQQSAIGKKTSFLRRPVDSVPVTKSALEKLVAKRIKKPPLKSPTQKPFNPRDYYISLSPSSFVPTLHKRQRMFYEQVDIKILLAHKDITSVQRDLFAYIFDTHNGRMYRSDVPRLLTLIAQSDIPVSRDYYKHSSRQRVIDLQPKPLQAEIVYAPRQLRMYGRKQPLIRHNFFLCVPASTGVYRSGEGRRSFSLHGSTMILDDINTLALYQLTPLLAGIMSRIETVYDYETGERDKKHYRALFTGEEVARYEEIVRDAKTHLDLTSEPPQFIVRKSRVCQSSIAVDFDSKQRTLNVSPVIDYGMHRQDVSESVRVSARHGRKMFVRREPFEYQGSHIVVVLDMVIHTAKVNVLHEQKMYKELARRADRFGFTKTLKCVKRGDKPIATYLKTAWPALTAYADQQKYPVVFLKDSLAIKRETFRAEFAVDMNESNDWLYFDVACYCGDEKITLEKLLIFLESGDTFFRAEDDTLVEIENREELERLARLLKSFHAREQGGFESKLYHASELEYVITSSPHYNAARADSFKKFLTDVKKGKPVKPVRVPRHLSSVLRPYQRAGVEWLSFLRSYRFAGILADDMGLGKTVQTLSLISMKRVAGTPSIIVCPKTLLYNWRAEVDKFTPELTAVVYEGSPGERTTLRAQMSTCDLVIVSYSTLKVDETYFTEHGQRFAYAVLDEAQYIKNHKSKTAQTVKKLNAEYRLALTGTPLENTVSELWSIFDFCMPGFLGSYEQFARYYHKPIMVVGDPSALEHLKRKVECFMLRRTKTEVLPELPPKIEQTSVCHLSVAQSVLYQQVLAKVRGDVFAAVKDKGFAGAQIHILAGLTKLRLACDHPGLLTKENNWRVYESAKLDMCMELIGEAIEGGRKVLVFSQFTKMLDILSSALKDKDISHLTLTGETRHRQTLIDQFNTDAHIPVFLISLKTGGVGLNLTVADMVIMFDPWWNPSVENQAIDRTHRIGQQHTVNVYRLITTGTIEEKIQTLKEKKQRLFDAMVNESKNLFKKLTWEDIRDLFKE